MSKDPLSAKNKKTDTQEKNKLPMQGIATEGKRNQSNKKYLFLLSLLVLGGVALGLGWKNKVFFSADDNENKTKNTIENTKEEDSKPKEAPVNQPERIRLDKLVLTRPPLGEGNVLIERQIGWCLYQKIRIDTLRTSLKEDSSIAHLNKETDAYNSRCGSYRYSQGSFSVAKNDVQPFEEKIIADAKAEASVLDEKLKYNMQTSKDVVAQPNMADIPIMPLDVQPTNPSLANLECALVTKITPLLEDAQEYIAKETKNSKFARIHKLKNDKYAVAIGKLKPEQLTKLASWKEEGKVPSGASCFELSAFKIDKPVSTKQPTKTQKPKQQAPIVKQPNKPTKAPKPVTNTPKKNTKKPSNDGYYQYSQPLPRVQEPRPVPSYNPKNNANNSGYNQNYNQQNNSYAEPTFEPPKTNGLETGSFSAGFDDPVSSNKNQREIDNLFQEHGSVIERRTDTRSNVTTITNQPDFVEPAYTQPEEAINQPNVNAPFGSADLNNNGNGVSSADDLPQDLGGNTNDIAEIDNNGLSLSNIADQEETKQKNTDAIDELIKKQESRTNDVTTPDKPVVEQPSFEPYKEPEVPENKQQAPVETDPVAASLKSMQQSKAAAAAKTPVETIIEPLPEELSTGNSANSTETNEPINSPTDALQEQ